MKEKINKKKRKISPRFYRTVWWPNRQEPREDSGLGGLHYIASRCMAEGPGSWELDQEPLFSFNVRQLSQVDFELSRVDPKRPDRRISRPPNRSRVLG